MKTSRGLILAAVLIGTAGVALSQTNPAPTAPPAPERAIGTLVKVSGREIVVRPGPKTAAAGNEVSFKTDDATEIQLDGMAAKLEDLRPEMFVSVMRAPARPPQTSRMIVMASSPGFSGTIVRVEGRNLIVRQLQAGGDSKEVSVATDEHTKVRMLGATAGRAFGPPGDLKLEDLKPGTRVRVSPETGTAQTIFTTPIGPRRPILPDRPGAPPPPASPGQPAPPPQPK